ncbi:hypothetical protein CHLRE_05g232950v5 [Chlamydomonas reinhardtii]|uniref:Micro-fibrillar-associated protein 1 C-terminal domain-containing protein n=1 Tax=Chlamydomonas reinhardtii TaxID=3055 RepID=A0A2K3DRY1_CHLRE|nr:uncharacterized protein CHLRE_05g232950v5 [Chlamydomonas reinhardtii]PNW83267.1 hypothetical protein CHLRE_05g232950v5 [Chlamydomonas reinhardtii]
MSGAFAARTALEESDKGRVDRTRVKRYWPGKAPEWAEQQEEAEAAAAPRDRVRTEVAAPVIVRRADDPRLARLQQSRGADREEALQERRQIRAAEIVRVKRERSEEPDGDGGGEGDGGAGGPQARRRARSEEPSEEADEEEEEAQLRRRRRGESEEPEAEQPVLEGDVPADEMQRRVARRRAAEGQGHKEEEEDDEEAVARRRAAVRERLLQQQREEEERRRQQQQEEESEEEEEESSEYETDDEDDGPGGRLLKPVFVPKHARDTVAERAALEEEEEAVVEKDRARKAARKEETKAILAEQMALEAAAAAAAAAGPAGVDDIDTDDDEEPVAAYEAWKGRELRRIKRDREERETAEREAAERERLKNMTEEERAAWEKANPKAVREASPKAKWNFLQKYWHKGAFFQETADDTRGTTGVDDIFKRDYSAPTGMDKFDKSMLPKVMQVKNFGRAGRTKYTHLLDQDTTQVEDELYAATKDNIVRRKEQALAAAQVFAKPRKFKR